jgi:poly [ADP-ribose] polymerase
MTKEQSSGEEVLLEFIEKVKSTKETGQKAEAVWSDFSQRWFTLMHSTRPFIFRDFQEIADHVRETEVLTSPIH